MKFGKANHATGHFEPDVGVVFIPRCPACHAANPHAEDNCPVCGAEAPMARRQPVLSSAAVLNRLFPWHGRVLLAIGAALTRLAKWVEGDSK